MRRENVAIDRGLDWKGLGYVVSIVSVFLLGAIAWPTPGEPSWYLSVLIGGLATSILGMGFRYKAHLDEQEELKQLEEQERRRS